MILPQERISKNKNRVKIRPKRVFICRIQAATTAILLVTQTNCSFQKHQFLGSLQALPNNQDAAVCKTMAETVVTSLWLKENTAISFNIQGSITTTQFIPDDSNAKQYSMLERGSICYMPSSSYSGWIFVGLVIEQHPSVPKTCYVSRVLTTSHLETCGGGRVNVETLLRFNSGTYDSIPQKTRIKFEKENLPDTLNSINIFTLSSSFTFSSIDEDFFELLLL